MNSSRSFLRLASFSAERARSYRAFSSASRFWFRASGRLLWALIGHTDRVNAVLFAPDGETLASSGRDYTVRLWNVADGRQRWLVPGFGQMVFLADRQTLLAWTCDTAGQIRTGNHQPRE